MRSLLCALALLIGTSGLAAQGIAFFEGTYEQALAAAKAQGKLVFVDAYAVWCGPCRRMSSDVFPRENVGAVFNESFVSMKIDMEHGEGLTFGKLFPVSSYPTLLFISPEGELVQRVIGAQSPENLIQQAQLALRKSDLSETYAKRYNSGERDPQLVAAYVKALNRSGKPSLAIANDFLRGDVDFGNDDVIAVIYEACVQADSRVFAILTEQRKSVERVYGAPAVDTRIAEACTRTLHNGLTYRSDALVAEAKAAMEQHLPSRAKAFDAQADLAVAKRNNDAGLAYKAAKKVVLADGNSAAANYEMAVDLARSFADQPDALSLAAKMAGTAAKAEPNFEHLYTHARLLAATGKSKQAKAQVERARDSMGQQVDARRAALVTELLQQLEG